MPWKEKRVMDLRNEFVQKALLPGSNLGEYGISRPTGYKWMKRFKDHGYQGLADISKRPMSCRHELDTEVCLEIVLLKTQHPSWGPKKIHTLYHRKFPGQTAPSVSSVERILKRVGLVKHRKKRHPRNVLKKKEMIHPKACNDVWLIDFKGWWLNTRGSRCEPFTVRDEYSKFVFAVTILENSKRESVQRELERLFTL